MTEQERLKFIEEELKVIVCELNPRLNELIFINECLQDLIRVSEGKEPKHI